MQLHSCRVALTEVSTAEPLRANNLQTHAWHGQLSKSKCRVNVNYDYGKLEHCIHYHRVMRHLKTHTVPSVDTDCTSLRTFMSRGSSPRNSSMTSSLSHFPKSRSDVAERRSSADEPLSQTFIEFLHILVCFVSCWLHCATRRHVSRRARSCWPRLEPQAALLRLVQLRNSMLFELIGSTTQRECQPRGLCASSETHDPPVVNAVF